MFPNILKVYFFVGRKQITKRKDYDGKLSDDNSLHLDLNDAKDRAILRIIMETDTIGLDGLVYRVLERQFMVDSTALFVTLKEGM